MTTAITCGGLDAKVYFIFLDFGSVGSNALARNVKEGDIEFFIPDVPDDELVLSQSDCLHTGVSKNLKYNVFSVQSDCVLIATFFTIIPEEGVGDVSWRTGFQQSQDRPSSASSAAPIIAAATQPGGPAAAQAGKKVEATAGPTVVATAASAGRAVPGLEIFLVLLNY